MTKHFINLTFLMVLCLLSIIPSYAQDTAHEIVHGNMDDITQTRAGYTTNDSEIHVWSQFLKDGEWTEKSQATYIKAPDAKVKF